VDTQARWGYVSAVFVVLLGTLAQLWANKKPRQYEQVSRVAIHADSLALWHAVAEACAGKRRPLRELRGIWTTPRLILPNQPLTERAPSGIYDEATRHIVVAGWALADGAVIRHELAHFVRGDGAATQARMHEPPRVFACAERGG
jgi:hypothetical protein